MTEFPDLRPGYNDQLLWSVVRHDLLSLARHLLCEKKWKLETRGRGMTMLQMAVLYGHTEMVSFLFTLDISSPFSYAPPGRRNRCFNSPNFWLQRIKLGSTGPSPATTSHHFTGQLEIRKLYLARSLLNLGARSTYSGL